MQCKGSSTIFLACSTVNLGRFSGEESTISVFFALSDWQETNNITKNNNPIFFIFNFFIVKNNKKIL
jgi:hypothetical protein